ncbi:hypothetical protein C7293_13470 [filamentous cyanobacterium CCT1]|nr:hypothetical protein C7293_13470 [filamentous cyanobacterium CCT1]PSN77860.1 hypothetical protein C8B47_19850 [filamentous cyanobacterium CCP4]
MPSPFPGMDPYLEQQGLWPEFHNRLLVAIADVLGPQLRPKYRVAIEKRVYQDAAADLQIGRPDAAVFRATSEANLAPQRQGQIVVEPVMVELPMPEEITERFLEIREVGTEAVVTTLELLSPSNKRAGKGRQLYEAKRLKVLGSQTHLVEIDLIRAFGPLPLRGATAASLYRIVVSRVEQRPLAALYGFNLSDPIPSFPVPLQADDRPVWVDLQDLVNGLYDRASYDLAINYSQDPIPPLSPTDAVWAREWLMSQGVLG